MSRNLCNCPNCQTDNCPAARELAEAIGWWESAADALNKHIEKVAVLERELAEFQRTEPLKLAERNGLLRDLAAMTAERDSEQRVAAQYKQELDKARACLREAIDMAQTTDDQFADKYNDIDVPAILQRWRTAGLGEAK
jgi:hypothetical protein